MKVFTWLALVFVLAGCVMHPPIISSADTALNSTALGSVSLAWDTSKRNAETDSSGRVSFLPLTYSDIDYVSGKVRYLTATFRVTNLSNAPLENVGVRAVAKVGNLGETAAFEVLSFPDLINPNGILFTEPSVAQRILPLHAMQLGATVPIPDSAGSDFMAYRPLESATLEAAAKTAGLLGATETVLDYGFIAKNTTSRSIPVGGTGIISVAVQIPRNFLAPPEPVALPKIFKFKLSFLVTTDSATRVSRAILEPSSDAAARAVGLGSGSNPSQLMLIGTDVDAPVDAALRLIRLPNIRIGSSSNLLP